jgi:hypothetical protein
MALKPYLQDGKEQSIMKQISIEIVIKNAGSSEPNEWDEFKDERRAWLAQFPHSIVVATSYLEMEYVQSWLSEKSMHEGVKWKVYFYYKESYDFGYAEYFFQDEQVYHLFKNEIPNFYGVFYNGKKLRSDDQGGYFEVK